MKNKEDPKAYAPGLKHCNLFATDELICRVDMAKERSTHVAETIETSGAIPTEKHSKNETEHVRTEVILDGVCQICTKISKKNGTKERNT